MERLDSLRDFIANGLIDVRVRVSEEGHFQAKGVCIRADVESAEVREGFENVVNGGYMNMEIEQSAIQHPPKVIPLYE